MEIGLTGELAALHDAVEDFFREELGADFEGLRRVFATEDPDDAEVVERLTRAAAERGWLALQETHGSRAAGVFAELVGFTRAPIEFYMERELERLVRLVGTSEQQSAILPLLSANVLRGCISFTEPGCGSDLAALTTTAVRDGDEFVVSGQKAFSSGAHVATHALVALKTDPSAGRHGISLLLVDLSLPGVVVNKIDLLAQSVGTCQIFFDDVRVPTSFLIGEEGGGLRYALMLLQAHRIRIREAGTQRRMVDEVVVTVKEMGERALEVPPAVLEELAWRRVESEVARLLQWRALWAEDAGVDVPYHASMANMYLRETNQRLAQTAMEVVGPFAPLSPEAEGVVARGAHEERYLYTPIDTIAGGTSEIQRNIIAESGLGMPRAERR